MPKTKKHDITIDATKCTGCQNCQLRCAFLYTRAFNPRQARIVVDFARGKDVHFTPECTYCALCVEYCVYGALRVAVPA